MALIGNISLGLQANTAAWDHGLRRARAQLDAFRDHAIRIAAIAASGFAALKIGGGIVNAVGQASDLNETVSKSRQVFGEASKLVEADADKIAKSFGISKKEYVDGAAAIGLVGKASGLTADQAAAMGSKFASLATDLGSFHNVSTEDALAAIRSGLTGEAEPLRRFGVLLNEAAVKSEALALGLGKGHKELTDGEKVQARASLIMKQTADAQGDLARTSGGTANQMRQAWGRFDAIVTSIGQHLEPIAAQVLQGFNGVLTSVQSWLDGSQETITAWLEWFTGGIKSAIDFAATVWRNWPLIVQEAMLRGEVYFRNLGEIFSWLGASIGEFFSWFSANWQSVFTDAFELAKTVFANLAQNIATFASEVKDWIASGFTDPVEMKFTPVLEGFKASSPGLKLPELKLSSVDEKQLAAIHDQMSSTELKAIESASTKTAAVADAAKATTEAGDAAAPGKAAEYHQNAALELGSKEARSAILSYRFGQESGDKAVLDVNKQQLAELKKLNAKQPAPKLGEDASSEYDF